MKVLHDDLNKSRFFAMIRIPLAVDAALAALTLVLSCCARWCSGFAEGYAASVYPLFTATLGRLFGFLPFSVFEWFCLALILYLPVEIIQFVIRYRKNRVYIVRKRLAAHALSRFLTVLLSCLLLYTMTCGVNYHRTPFSAHSGLQMRKTDTATLDRLCGILTAELCAAAENIAVDDSGCSILPDGAQRTAADAMDRLGEEFSALHGTYPLPKPLISSVLFSYGNITGIYAPFTLEANYNREIVSYNLPFTMCHELSHLRGFMREDEANFIAYLACRNSGDAYFRYSGAMLAYIYAVNALYDAGATDAARAYSARLPEVARKDFTANNAFWAQYETKIAVISDQINDTYLKANSQPDGVQSYGRVVDLLIAYHLPEDAD